MSVRYDPLLARALAHDILARWRGARTDAFHLSPGHRAALLVFEDRTGLLALLHPTQGWIVAVEETDATAEALDGWTHRFHRRRLADAFAPPDERAVQIELEDAGGARSDAIVLELHTNRWNALRLSAAGGPAAADAPEGGEPTPGVEWRIEAVATTRESGGRTLRRGAPYTLPRSDRRGLDPAARPDPSAWAEVWEEAAPDRRRTEILRTWAWTSTLNIDAVLGAGSAEAGYERHLELLGAAAALDASGSGSRGGPGEHAWTHDMRWGLQPYPLALSRDAVPASGILDAMSGAQGAVGSPLELLARVAADAAGDEDEADLLARKLRKRMSRTRKRIAALERQLDGAEDPETPRGLGHLLLARKAQVPRGTARVSLDGFDGTVQELELDPKLDAIGNAEALFSEAKRRERALERLPLEIGKAEAKRDALSEGLASLERDGPTDALWELVGGRGRKPAPRRRSEEPERLPYRTLRSSGGLEIRVGRGPKDNDDLTFRHSAPDDIWLHASQASGAHVIVRWGLKEENPPKRDLVEAAIAAAVYSGARHSGTVAVVWTRRKYVRKPRKSPPGQVIAERSQTLFVTPDEDVLKRLSPGP